MVNSSDVVAGENATAPQYNTLRDDVFAPFDFMTRQAIINGNFDIWQRATSIASLSNTTIQYCADRWFDYHAPDGGTLPTLTRSRQLLTPGDIPHSYWFSRLATNGAGSGFGAGCLGVYEQRIEHGNRYLAGASKYLTVTFYARSSISGKKIGVYLSQNYGTGGSPSSAEIVSGDSPITLTTSWVKYTKTFTLNTLVGKTFGNELDDFMTVAFAYLWGSTTKSYVGASTAETYVGSGNIDIAQVQVNSDTEALEFRPRTHYEELRLCERYYQKSFDETTVPAQATGTYNGALYVNNNSSVFQGMHVKFRTRMRPGQPTITTYSPIASDANWYDSSNGQSRTVGTPDVRSEQGFRVTGSAFSAGGNYENWIHWTAERELA
jgi:hypothetical protein